MSKFINKFPFLFDNSSSSISALLQNIYDLFVDFSLRLFGVIFCVLCLLILEPSKFLVHAVLSDYHFGDVVGFLKVIVCSSGHFAEEHLF